MPVKKSKKLRIAQRRQRVADLYVKGWTQASIAADLNVAQSTICDDLKKIQAEWRDSRIRDFDTAREIELKRIDHIGREAWDAWERSQQPEQSANTDNSGRSGATRRRVKNRYGDPRFLEVAMKCTAARRDLLGLDAPKKVAATTPDGQALSLEQRQVHLNAIIVQQLGMAGLAETGGNHETQGTASIAGEPLGRGVDAIESVVVDAENDRADQDTPSTAS